MGLFGLLLALVLKTHTGSFSSTTPQSYFLHFQCFTCSFKDVSCSVIKISSKLHVNLSACTYSVLDIFGCVLVSGFPLSFPHLLNLVATFFKPN